MVKRIKISELVELIQSRQLTEADAGKYFSFAKNPANPMDFRTAINPEYVDITHFEPLARDASLLVRSIEFRKPATRAAVAAASGRALVAEGDSWFKLPSLPGVPPTSVDLLISGGERIANLAHWGDTLDDMLAKGDFWSYIDGGSDILLFSGGGNDVLGGGELAAMLNQYNSDYADPKFAKYYVRDSFYENLRRVSDNLESALIKPMRDRKANKKIIMHGYDYAIPQENGPWLGSPMYFRGLDPVYHADLCRAIVKLMIDAYNTQLKAFAGRYPDTFIYVDLRGVVRTDQWWDELHGREAAAKAISTRLKAAIKAAEPSAHQQIVSRLYPKPAAA